MVRPFDRIGDSDQHIDPNHHGLQLQEVERSSAEGFYGSGRFVLYDSVYFRICHKNVGNGLRARTPQLSPKRVELCGFPGCVHECGEFLHNSEIQQFSNCSSIETVANA